MIDSIAWLWQNNKTFFKSEIEWADDYSDCLVVYHWCCLLWNSEIKPNHYCESLLPETGLNPCSVNQNATGTGS